MIDPLNGIDALYEHAVCGYVDTDAHGAIVRANQTFLRWTGYGVDELRGRLFRDLLTPGGRIFHDTHLAPLLAMQDRVNEIALDVVCRAGTDLPVLATILRYPDVPSGAASQRIVLFSAADRRTYERELMIARRRAEEAASARAALLLMLSHDVRIPLHVILGAADLLQQSPVTPEQQECVDLLTSSAASLLALVEQVLAVNRVESAAPTMHATRFDLPGLVGAVVSSFAGLAKQKGLSLHTSIDGRLADVAGDPMVIRQVMTNLVANAIKSTDRGAIAVNVTIEGDVADDMSVVFQVVDSGPGIATDRLATLVSDLGDVAAEPPRASGGGIGLPICRWLLERCGSELRVTSAEGEGAAFSFALRVRRG